MNDDWRVQVNLEESAAEELLGHLEAREMEDDVSTAFHDRVIVSRDGGRLFFYAGSREAAEQARDLVLREAGEEGLGVQTELRHWHPAAEQWEDPDTPLPDGDAARLAERGELIAREREETEERGYPELEVRVDLPSHQEAEELAERLRAEGIPSVHRWKYVLVGAADEDAAKQLAERIEAEAPAGSTVKVEGTWKAALGEAPRNPFAVFGGLGG
jgi:predicted thioesterase